MHPPLTGSNNGPATFKHRSCEAEVITNGIGDILLSMITIMDTTIKATKLHFLNEASNFWLILAAHNPEVTSKKSIATEKFSTIVTYSRDSKMKPVVDGIMLNIGKTSYKPIIKNVDF